jgi:hypothetical protein
VGFTHLCVAHKKLYVEQTSVMSRRELQHRSAAERYTARNLTGHTSHLIF